MIVSGELALLIIRLLNSLARIKQLKTTKPPNDSNQAVNLFIAK